MRPSFDSKTRGPSLRPSWDYRTSPEPEPVPEAAPVPSNPLTQIKDKIMESVGDSGEVYNTATNWMAGASSAYLKFQLLQALMGAGGLNRE